MSGGWLPPTDGPDDRPADDRRRGGDAPEKPLWATPSPAPSREELPGAGATSAWPGEPAGAPRATPVAGNVAGYLPRVGAAVIDAFVRLAFVLAGMLVGAVGFAGGTEAGEAGILVGAVIGAIAGVAYAPIMLARTGGQTVGHKATDTRIVMRDGSRMSGGQATLREVVVKMVLIDGIGGFLVIPTIVNYLWPLWDEHNEALHDKICSTRVVEA